jgi:outer membrane receptor protein involved in Fe transport
MPIRHARLPVRRRLASVALAIGLTMAAPATVSGQPGGQGRSASLTGLVTDTSGASIPGATVTAYGSAGELLLERVTNLEGFFDLTDLPAWPTRLLVRAPGFADVRLQLAGATETSLRIVLAPATVTETVTVTGSRGTPGLESAVSVTVVTSAELSSSAAGSLDDVLRNTPGFSLFRRSSSRTANPSSQGVTLRGLAGSGASRTLVLADGVPLNDPFGSWVYWNRIPQAAIDRVEVVRGATGDLYGPDALGGVIQVLTIAPSRAQARATLEAGGHGTRRGSGFAGAVMRGWSVAGSGEWLDTDGVFIVARDERGPADVRANSNYRSVFGTAGYGGNGWRTLVRASQYSESRSNGTPLQVNDTNWRQVSAEAAGSVAGGVWIVRAAGARQRYYNSFSSVAVDRRTERLTNDQRIPSEFASASGQWTREIGAHAILIGTEGRRTRSIVEETRYGAAGATGPFVFGGSEVNGSLFGRVSLVPADAVTIVIGARGDVWTSEPRNAGTPSHRVDFFSPRASLAWRARTDLTLRAAAYRAYRTPTLNELHRGFRVGNTVTDGNPLLQPERLTGIEGGVAWTRPRLSARVTGFFNHLDGAITNVTLQTTPTLITRQKQNADVVRAAGLEIELDVRPATGLTIGALAVFTASRFGKAPKLPELEGNRVPQVPGYQFGTVVTYAGSALTASGQVRAIGVQYDDDRNELRLGRFGVVDGMLDRRLAKGVHGFVAVENAFDVEYDVGRTPVRTIGWPRTARVGVRIFVR